MTLMQFTQRPKIDWRIRSGRERRNWCGICRRPPGGLFDVPTTVWRFYDQRNQVICIRCWHWLTDAVDGRAYQAEHGGPVPLWSDAWRERHGIPPDESPPPGLPPWFTVAELECDPAGFRGRQQAEQPPSRSRSCLMP